MAFSYQKGGQIRSRYNILLPTSRIFNWPLNNPITPICRRAFSARRLSTSFDLGSVLFQPPRSRSPRGRAWPWSGPGFAWAHSSPRRRTGEPVVSRSKRVDPSPPRHDPFGTADCRSPTKPPQCRRIYMTDMEYLRHGRRQVGSKSHGLVKGLDVNDLPQGWGHRRTSHVVTSAFGTYATSSCLRSHSQMRFFSRRVRRLFPCSFSVLDLTLSCSKLPPNWSHEKFWEDHPAPVLLLVSSYFIYLGLPTGEALHKVDNAPFGLQMSACCRTFKVTY